MNKHGHNISVRTAAHCFDVIRTTLQDRMNGMELRDEKHHTGSVLTTEEENVLVKRVWDKTVYWLPPSFPVFE